MLLFSKRRLAVLFSLLVIGLTALCAWLYTPDKSRAALEAKYAAPPSAFLEVVGIRLHVKDTGPRGAPVLILLHGFRLQPAHLGGLGDDPVCPLSGDPV